MSTIPQTVALVMRRNVNPWRQRFAVTDEDGGTHDFTGHVILMQVRLNPGAPGAPLIEVSSGDTTGTFIDVDATGFDVVIEKSLIAALPAVGTLTPPQPWNAWDVNLAYDIRVLEPGGDEEVWFEGVATVTPGVTA